MSECYTCGTPLDCECKDHDDWFQAAKDLLAIIGAVCVLGFVSAIIQRNF